MREAIAPMRLGLWMSPTSFNPSSQTFQSHPEWACAPLGDGLAAYNLADPDEQLQRGRDRAVGPGRAAPRRGAHPRRDRELGRRLLEVRLPPVARLRGARRRARPLRVPRRVPRDARPPAGRLPRRDLRDRRDERLPPLPLRVDLARTDLVPERRAEPRPHAAQPVEPEPLRAGVRARPGGARQPGLRALPGRHADGRGAALAHHLLPGHPPPAGRRHRPGAALDRLLQAQPRPARRRRLPAARRSAEARLDRAPGVGPARPARARCWPSARAPPTPRRPSRCETCRRGRTFALREGADETPLGTVTSAELAAACTSRSPRRRDPGCC